MKEHFHEMLEGLRTRLIAMGAEVEGQIRLSIEALTEADAPKARQVIERDRFVDQLEIRNEEDAIHLLATQQPVAGDLRFLEEMYNRINEDEATVQVTCPECGAKFEKEFGRLGES